MIRSTQQLLAWLEKCPDGRAVSLRYIDDPGPVGYSFAVEHISIDLLREIAEAGAGELLFIPQGESRHVVSTVDQWVEQVWDMQNQQPASNSQVVNLTLPGADSEPIKRLADPLRDPKLDWMRSKS